MAGRLKIWNNASSSWDYVGGGTAILDHTHATSGSVPAGGGSSLAPSTVAISSTGTTALTLGFSGSNLYSTINGLVQTTSNLSAGVSISSPLLLGTPAASSSLTVKSTVAGETYPRFQVYGDGKHEWGTGATGTLDTNLYRSAANLLATDDAFSPIGGLLAPTLVSTTGYLGWNATTNNIEYYDGQRARKIGNRGWAPYAFQLGGSIATAGATALTAPTGGGSVAIPVHVPSDMLLESVSFWNTDTATARSAEFRIYEQYYNNGNAGENTLTGVANATGAWSATPASAGIRVMTMASPPVYLPAGVYWLVIRNTHATSTLGIGYTATGAGVAGDTIQTKALASALSNTLDFVAVTWTKLSHVTSVRLNGRVFGQTALF